MVCPCFFVVVFFFSFPSFHSDLTQIPTRIIMAKVGWKLCYCIGDKSLCSWETRSSTNLLSPAAEQMLKGKGRPKRVSSQFPVGTHVNTYKRFPQTDEFELSVSDTHTHSFSHVHTPLNPSDLTSISERHLCLVCRA